MLNIIALFNLVKVIDRFKKKQYICLCLLKYQNQLQNLS